MRKRPSTVEEKRKALELDDASGSALQVESRMEGKIEEKRIESPVRKQTDQVIVISSDSDDGGSLSSSDSSDDDDFGSKSSPKKRQKLVVILPPDFLAPLKPHDRQAVQQKVVHNNHSNNASTPVTAARTLTNHVSKVKEEPSTAVKASEAVTSLPHNHNNGDGAAIREAVASRPHNHSESAAIVKAREAVAWPPHNHNDNTVVPLAAVRPLPNLVSAIKKEPLALVEASEAVAPRPHLIKRCSKQFWKAGDFERSHGRTSTSHVAGVDRLRVHPRFLHSNATSHKWVLGAFAELLDNALDEVRNGATYVNIDALKSKDGNALLVVEDNGGGMTPDKIRQCMSLGYSEKSNLANTIGQYGNGFKTSTMRIGADAIVFSRCRGRDGRRGSQSIGMLSYTFLVKTEKEEIIVPMIDYEKRGEAWNMMVRSTAEDWKQNLETIVQWSPYRNEDDLLKQFNNLKDQGTCIIIYNLWEDDQGQLEIDLTSDQHDIQVRGVDRNEKNVLMPKDYPNSKHYLTYHHSLRIYASILYLRIPHSFRMILRGKEVEHHNIVSDMLHSKELIYRPQGTPEGAQKYPNISAVITIGFGKDAHYHIDVQGFNVYHKNRLIKPFWRVYTAGGSNGRGVIGVVEADFVEPTHDKQDFERTIVYSRLETQLKKIQKNYWASNAYLIGYASGRNKAHSADSVKDTVLNIDKSIPVSHYNGHAPPSSRFNGTLDPRSTSNNAVREKMGGIQDKEMGSTSRVMQPESTSNWKNGQTPYVMREMDEAAEGDRVRPDLDKLVKLQQENEQLKKLLEAAVLDLGAERGKVKSMEKKIEKVKQEKEVERIQRERQEEALRARLQNASDVIDQLSEKVKRLEWSRGILQRPK